MGVDGPMNVRNLAWVFCLILGLAMAAPLAAQTCDDASFCTVNDMCAAGTCTGTPIGGGCDDGNSCTVNDTCLGGECRGTPGNTGGGCNDGCGTCQFGQCILNVAANGNPCNDEFVCTTNDRCQFGICFGDYKLCPDSDGDACTFDFCHPITGACVATEVPPCGDCQACTEVDGEPDCNPAGNGNSCDDFNECTGDGVCSSGECLDGPPVSPGQGTATPTRSATPQATATAAVATSTPTTVPTLAPTATRSPTTIATLVPTATVPPTVPATATVIPTGVPTATAGPTGVPTPTVPAGTCNGDCNGDSEVTVDEVITGVNIALGSVAVANCRAMDTNSDQEVTVDEILKAINAALNGCS